MNTKDQFIICDFLASMISDSVIIFDFIKKSFNYVLKSGFSSCSYADGTLSCDCFRNIIHSNDRDFFENVYRIVQDSLNKNELPKDQVNYFSFLLRINCDLSSNEKSNYFMTYVKLKPQWENGLLRYGICILSASVVKEQSNQLLVHYKNMDYSEYSFIALKWKYHSFSPLNEKQKQVLIWAQQGLSLKETADKMNVSNKMIENIRTMIFEKFEVKSIEQAIQYAANRRLI